MINKYKYLEEFNEKLRQFDYRTFLENQEKYKKEFLQLIENHNLDINEVVEDYNSVPFRYVTPLLYILQLDKSYFSEILFEQSIDKINSKIIVGDMQNDLLTVLYESLERSGHTKDRIIPLVFHFESLEYMDRVSSTDKKIVIVNYLISKFEEYDPSEEFRKKVNKLKDKLMDYKEESMISNIASNINETIGDIEKLTSPNENMIKIKNKLLEARELFKDKKVESSE